MTKEAVQNSLTKATYSAKEVIHLLGQVTVLQRLPYVIKGDCFTQHVGIKKRPCCVIKVVGNLCYAIPMSTTEDELNLIKTKPARCSHKQQVNYFSKSVIVAPVEVVLDNFLFNYENNAVVNKAIREMRKLMADVLG